MNYNLEEMIDGIRQDIISGTYQVKQSKRFLIEKSVGLCRQMTIVHPRDLLVLERLSRSLYFELKSKSPSKSAFFEPDDGNFVQGFQQSDFEYGSFASWKRFQSAVFGFAEEKEYIVVTDVANFYDFINFQHLRNIISSLVDVREEILDILIYILNRLTWTPDFMPLTQVGMPQIETTATRVLANALLFEVDKICEDFSNLNYARFMDDMDVGVDTPAAAKRVVRDIDLTLQSRQLRLNSSKTKILTKEQAFHHFRIDENSTLSIIEKYIDDGDITKARKEVEYLYKNWIDASQESSKSILKGGNGPKIHKRILRILYMTGGSVPDDALVDLVENDPGMRSTALRYLSHSKVTKDTISRLFDLVLSGNLVDDASVIEISSLLLHARVDSADSTRKIISDFIQSVSDVSDIQLYCAIFLSGKFQDRGANLTLLRKNIVKIRDDFWLSRAAAGLTSKFLSTEFQSPYVDVIRRLRTDEAESVFNFFDHLKNVEKLSQSEKAYFKKQNDSFPQKIFYPKLLQILALRKNSKIGPLYKKIEAIYPCLNDDPYFKAMGF